MFRSTILSTLFLFLAFLVPSYGQTPETGLKPSIITGEVAVLNATKMIVNTKDGAVEAILSAKTEFKRVPADNPSLKAAVAAAMGDIGVGDKVAVTGVLSSDKKSLPARAIYLMTKADISEKHAKESEAWKTRGIAGRVTTVNSATNQITLDIRTLTGSTTTVITPKETAKFRRYAPDSVKYDEAKEGTIADIKQGDMLRALGDKSSDGTSFAAEEIVSGAFQTIAGTVKSVDVEKNEVVLTNLQTKKDVTVALGGASVLKKFPAEMAERMAGAQAGGGGGIRPPGQGGVRPPGQENAPANPAGQAQPTGVPGQGGQGRGFGGRGGGGIDDMLDRFPNITAADLKPGDMIAVSSSKNGDMTRINAIKLVAGVEPFLRMAQASGRGRGGQGVDTGFSIPGLDSIGFP